MLGYVQKGIHQSNQIGGFPQLQPPSSQIIIFHAPGFSSNKWISLP